MIIKNEMLAMDAAKKLKMNPNFLVRLLSEGRVHGRKIVGRWFVSESEIDRINAQKRIRRRKGADAARSYTHWGL